MSRIPEPPFHLAARMADIQPFHVMALLARARELEATGRSIVHMEIGEPDFGTPEPIVAAGIAALRAGHTHYTPARGLPALREAISDYYRTRYGVTVAAERIIVTPGASGALLLALGVLVNPGERVLMADPGYPCNRHFVRLMEGKTGAVAVDAQTGFQLTARLIDSAWDERAVAVLLASPANPTGTLVEAAEMARIIATTQRLGGRMIVDEIYHGLVYEHAAPTALALSDQVFVVNSFSKYFGMTGWRLGWLVAPQAYVPELDKLAQNLFLAASTPAQYAALAAFEPDTLAVLEQRRKEFQARRDYLLPALRELDFEIPGTPGGAFYLYANCSRHTTDSYRFATELLEQAGVAITPGVDFGCHHPERHVRFAYTTALDQLEVGVRRLRHYLGH